MEYIEGNNVIFGANKIIVIRPERKIERRVVFANVLVVLRCCIEIEWMRHEITGLLYITKIISSKSRDNDYSLNV